MVVVNPERAVTRGAHEVDIAGVRWPVYKLEALALGLFVALALVLITGSAQLAVLVAAAVAAVRWAVAVIGPRIHSMS
ncbi:hypothetical protein [Nocardia macrotermitis]|uniref:Uncharacterized protein n=1 Tax=Nocardia macrotermitis TaxID=2585198 RepID=A0A7K0D7C2_9NOCA|nr:hypothetical protein [Nocardia macrotermitis]MQY21242.1 hypothetical protein [Nocardia macrotermitis]